MDKTIYIITNCGGVEEIFDDEQEMKERYRSLVEAESKYTATHYYYDHKAMTRAEFVCDKICSKSTELHNAEFMSKNTGKSKTECFNYLMWSCRCRKCALECYSPFKEVQDAGAKAEDN